MVKSSSPGLAPQLRSNHRRLPHPHSHPSSTPQVILEAWVKGVNPQGNSTNPSNWDFGSSFFFAGTVVTTIGKALRVEGAPEARLGWGSLGADAGERWGSAREDWGSTGGERAGEMDERGAVGLHSVPAGGWAHALGDL